MFCFSKAGAVSYTHLDVYKRQMVGASVADIRLEGKQQVSGTTVSYTHLDVYKRQVWIRGGLLIIIYALVFFVSWFCYRKYENQEEAIQVTGKELISCVIIGLAVFLISNLGFVSLTTPFGGRGAAEILSLIHI